MSTDGMSTDGMSTDGMSTDGMSTDGMSTDGMSTVTPARSRASRWRPWALVAGIVGVSLVLLVGVVLWWWPARDEYGTATRRVASPSGEFEIVQYEFVAMIDPGWNLIVERIGTDEREWFWRSVESPAPDIIRFTGPTSVEVVDEQGRVHQVRFDPDTLEPTDRICLRPEYCWNEPWDEFTVDPTPVDPTPG